MFLSIVVLCQCLIITPPVSRSILLGHEQRNSNLKINRKLPFLGNSKEFAQFHTKNILAKNKTHEKTRFMGTPRYQRQKLTESYRFKEAQKNLLSFTQRTFWPKTRHMKKLVLWATLATHSKQIHSYFTRSAIAGNVYVEISRTNQRFFFSSRIDTKISSGIPSELRQLGTTHFKRKLNELLLKFFFFLFFFFFKLRRWKVDMCYINLLKYMAFL